MPLMSINCEHSKWILDHNHSRNNVFPQNQSEISESDDFAMITIQQKKYTKPAE